MGFKHLRPNPPDTDPELEQAAKEWDKLKGSSVMQAALGELGLTPDLAAKALAQELGATTVRGQLVDGRWTYTKPTPNWEVRQRARQDLTKYWGSYKPDDKEDDGPLVVEIRDCTQPTPAPTPPAKTGHTIRHMDSDPKDPDSYRPFPETET